MPVKEQLTLSTSMETPGEAPQQPCETLAPPQPRTPVTLQQALYLLSTGKLARIPDILSHAPLIDLFNHFLKELAEDPHWAITPAGMDYDHFGYEYIIKEEARHFACQAYNMIHPDVSIQILTRYQ
ncbi:hypothetical protein ARMGADRAFT_1069602 [Armillaria gallica]|uniref:Uncharacterized protein n=1 Tax=Armillaria gallica TaxID=47427 RepID=A0A2H3E6G0_ARMGA|nr:hypothetical protein ARMGADRAFT_1069602 [Armillaria gallica]